MTLGWTLFSIKALIGYAFMSGLFAIFASCSLANNINKTLPKWLMLLLNSSLLWLPATSLIAAIALGVAYSKQQTSDITYWLALPIIALVAFVFIHYLIESKYGHD